MNPDQINRDAGIVHTIVNATMPDGSPIMSSTKADIILKQFGFDPIPPVLRQLVELGVVGQLKAARARRRRVEGQANV